MRTCACTAAMIFLVPSTIALATVGILIMTRFNMETTGRMVVPFKCVSEDGCIVRYMYALVGKSEPYYTSPFVCERNCVNGTTTTIYYNNFHPEKVSFYEYTGNIEVGIALIALSTIFTIVTICIIISYFIDVSNTVSIPSSASITVIPTRRNHVDIEMHMVSVDADSRNDINLAKPDQQAKSPDFTVVVFKYP